MSKRTGPAGRPDKRNKKRVMVRPVASPDMAAAPSGNAVAASRPAWASSVRPGARSGGMIKDEDYRFIYGDLRRIAMVAGSLFLVLIALTFFLR